jgi:anti-sigma B factor antagonist
MYITISNTKGYSHRLLPRFYWLTNILPKRSITIQIYKKAKVMELQYSELDTGIRIIKLSGKLDLNGTYNVEIDFVRHCTGENLRVIVDLSKVNYISSIGIPMLINSAKLVINHGGKMALLNPQKAVADVLKITGIHLIIPIYENLYVAVTELSK